MKKKLFFFSLSFYLAKCALGFAVLSWDTAQPIPLGASQRVAFVTSAYDSTTGLLFGSWIDLNNSRLYYSIYSNGGWSAGAQIPLTSDVQSFPIQAMAYNPDLNAMFISWIKTGAPSLWYSMYSNGAWSTPSLADSASAAGGFALAFDASASGIIAALQDSSPSYSIYTSSWSNAAPIQMGFTTENLTPTAVYSPAHMGTFAVFNRLFAPYYTIYSGGSWSAFAPIPPGASTEFLQGSTCYNSTAQTVFVAWGSPISNIPYYSIYSAGNWSVAAQIPLGASAGPVYIVNIAYMQSQDIVVAVWVDRLSNAIYSSLYSSGSWTTPSTIPLGTSTGAIDSVYLTYSSALQGVVATWGDSGTHTPYYSILSLLQPPASLSGQQKTNDFVFVSEQFNHLSWYSSPSSGVVAYRVFREGTPIATLQSDLTQYNDHNQVKGQPVVYSVTSLDALGNESAPVSITVGDN